MFAPTPNTLHPYYKFKPSQTCSRKALRYIMTNVQFILHRGEKLIDAMHILLLLPPLTFLFYLSFYRARRKLPFPPGPPGLPLIGNMRMMSQLTHRGLAQLAKIYGGFVHLRLGLLHAFVISTPDMAQQILQAHDQVFANRPASVAIRYLTYDRNDMAFAHYGPFWRQVRKLCVMRLFSRRRAASWACVRDQVLSAVKDIRANAIGRPFNLGELSLQLTEGITFAAAFGAALKEGQEEFIRIMQEFSRLFGAFNLGDFFPWLGWLDLQGLNGRLRRARESLDRFIDNIIDEHMAHRKNPNADDTDMVDEMLVFLEEVPRDLTNGNSTHGGMDDLQATLKLTRINIKAIIMDVMFGGTETVASAIEWFLAELFHSPDELQKVQKELEDVIGLDRNVHESDLDKLPYFRCCVKEVLRLHPPIPMLLHETAEDCQLNGYRIPVGSRVMINVWAIGRDPLYWKDPDTFRPSRFATDEASGVDFRGSHFEFLPFGSGRRSCPGMQLGLYGLELAVANLIHAFNWELPDGLKPAELDMTDVFGLTAPRANRLVAVPTLRLNCEI